MRSSQTNWTAFNNDFFQLHGKKNRPQHKEYKEHKEYFICRDTGKIVIMFSETFPQNIYVAYLVCAHPIVTKKPQVCKELKSKAQEWICGFMGIN